MIVQFFTGTMEANLKEYYLHMLMISSFVLSKEEREMFKYLGLQIQQSTNGIEIHQKNYAEEVEAVKIDNSSKKDHALLPS